MARGWRINPPPNWPALPADWRPTEDWQPDPQWGPMPVGWTLWRRERRGAWLLRHRTWLGLGVGTLVILGSAFAGPAATELITAGGRTPAAAPPASGSELPGAQVPVPSSSTDIRTEPKVEPPVRRPQQSTPASRSRPRPRPSDDRTTVAAPTPSALPALPHAGEPVPQLRLGPLPTGSCTPEDETSDRRPYRDRHDRDSTDGRTEVYLVMAEHSTGDEHEDTTRHRPDGESCPAPATPTGTAPPG